VDYGLIVVMVVVAHPKMISGQTEKKTCVLIVRRTMNKMKEIIKEGWDVFPPWLMALNIFAIAIGVAVIIFI